MYEKAEHLKEKFGTLASNVVDEIISGLNEMYIYDNSEAYETREDEITWWTDVQKLINKK